jgi:hypothetical protein
MSKKIDSLSYQMKYGQHMADLFTPPTKLEVAKVEAKETFATLDKALKVRILEVIKKHSMDDKIKSPALASIFNIPETQLRTYVNWLRVERHPIGSDNGGYYYAQSFDELNHTIRQMLSRSRAIIKAANGLISCYSNEGQYEIIERQ